MPAKHSMHPLPVPAKQYALCSILPLISVITGSWNYYSCGLFFGGSLVYVVPYHVGCSFVKKALSHMTELRRSHTLLALKLQCSADTSRLSYVEPQDVQQTIHDTVIITPTGSCTYVVSTQNSGMIAVELAR